jgi:hypothetical protein
MNQTEVSTPNRGRTNAGSRLSYNSRLNGNAMNLKLQSKEFVFEKGQGIAIPKDFRPAGGIEGWIQRAGPDPLCPLVDNAINLKAIDSPGHFFLMLGDLTVRRIRDQLVCSVSGFSTNLQISEQDLACGTVELDIAESGLFRVTILDRESHPVPHKLLTFAGRDFAVGVPQDAFQFFSQGVHAGADGSFLAIDNPALWGILLDENTGLMIVPV